MNRHSSIVNRVLTIELSYSEQVGNSGEMSVKVSDKKLLPKRSILKAPKDASIVFCSTAAVLLKSFDEMAGTGKTNKFVHVNQLFQ